MHGSTNPGVTTRGLARLALVCCLAAAALPAWAREEPGGATLPTVYRDGWKIIVNGKPQVNGAFTMVFTALSGEPVTVTVNVVAKMKPKLISHDLWQQLSRAAGINYKVKLKGNKVVTISKANRKVPGLALEITEQKVSGMSLTISAD